MCQSPAATAIGFSQWSAVAEHPTELEELASDLVTDMTAVADEYEVGTVLRVAFDRRASRWSYRLN